jgi:hypothetical protein
LFDAQGDTLKVVARGTVEGLSVFVVHSGKASVPFPVFSGIAGALRFYRGKAVWFCFWVIDNQSNGCSPPEYLHGAIVAAKSPTPQNLRPFSQFLLRVHSPNATLLV